MDLQLADLLNMDISVATGGQKMTERESPGIVSVITADDIKKIGARDLVDVLRLVPGFYIEQDISGVLGLGIRGNWANEGKVLILIDGIDMNDDMYASYPHGQHIPVDHIDRIEIIRGPGSAIYGGAAELGVISIITKMAEDQLNIYAGITSGRTENILGRANGTVFAGSKGEAFSVSGALHYNRGNLSDSKSYDAFGTIVDLSSNDNSKQENVFANAKILVGGFRFDFLYDKLIIDFSYPGYYIDTYTTYFPTIAGKLSYDLHVNESFSVKPKFQYKWQKPWNGPKFIYDDGDTTYRYSDWENSETAMKYTLEVPVSFAYSENVNIIFGIRDDIIYGKDNLKLNFISPDSSNSVTYNNLSEYIQMLFKTPLGNFTLGGRSAYHNQYGFSIVPRFAYTLLFAKKFHLKALASGALREPTILNISYNHDIKPEKTWFLEAEFGVRPFTWLNLAVNGFYTNIQDAIAYTWDELTDQSIYKNGGTMASTGFEFISKLKTEIFFFNLSYSYNTILKNEVDVYQVPGVDDMNAALPDYKLTATGGVTIAEQLSLSPSLIYLGPRWGPDVADATWSYLTYKKFNSSLLLNACILWDLPWVQGLGLSFSVYNILNDEYGYLEAYNGWDTVVPGLSREYVGKISYAF
jgi:outer membrane cobalamin receptor